MRLAIPKSTFLFVLSLVFLICGTYAWAENGYAEEFPAHEGTPSPANQTELMPQDFAGDDFNNDGLPPPPPPVEMGQDAKADEYYGEQRDQRDDRDLRDRDARDPRDERADERNSPHALPPAEDRPKANDQKLPDQLPIPSTPGTTSGPVTAPHPAAPVPAPANRPLPVTPTAPSTN